MGQGCFVYKKKELHEKWFASNKIFARFFFCLASGPRRSRVEPMSSVFVQKKKINCKSTVSLRVLNLDLIIQNGFQTNGQKKFEFDFSDIDTGIYKFD